MNVRSNSYKTNKNTRAYPKGAHRTSARRGGLAGTMLAPIPA
jgi:hypothetical protein